MTRKHCLVVLLALTACGPGGDDDGGACSTILPGELVVSEIFGDYVGEPSDDDGREWFEIYNASSGAIDLEGLVITHSRVDGTSDKSHTMGTLTIAAGEYAVLGDVLPEFVTGFLDYGYGNELGGIFNTNGGKLAIHCGDELIDEVTYQDMEAGQATGFDGGATPDYTANDDLEAWCVAPDEPDFEFDEGNYGTPGGVNFDCQGGTAGMCDDGGTLRPTVVPAPGDLIITEALGSPTSVGDGGPGPAGEWIEVYVVNPVDLNGIFVARANGDSSEILADACLEVSPGDYLVFAKSEMPVENGSLPRVDGLFDFALVEDARLLDPGGNVIDAATFGGTTTGESFQLDPDFFDATANDDERFWCDATIAWAEGDLGSPGAANEQCEILPPEGQCVDPDTQTERDIVSPAVGDVILTEVMPRPSGTDSVEEWIEARTTAAFDLNGLRLQRTGATPQGSQILDTACREVPADSYILFARAGASTPAPDATYGTINLTDDCNTTSNCSLQLQLADATPLDTITWTAATADHSRQLAVGLIEDPVGNDTEANWCDGSTSYNGGADFGTPRADNTTCPPP